MNNVAMVRKLLAELVKDTDSSVYIACDEIVAYLEHNHRQRNITIGGLRAALYRVDRDDAILIQAAYTLTSHPFFVLDVRYKLYDKNIEDVIEELDHSTYMTAIENGHFIDDNGDELAIEDLNSRVFPYFINKLQYDMSSKPHSSVRINK